MQFQTSSSLFAVLLVLMLSVTCFGHVILEDIDDYATERQQQKGRRNINPKQNSLFFGKRSEKNLPSDVEYRKELPLDDHADDVIRAIGLLLDVQMAASYRWLDQLRNRLSNRGVSRSI